MDVLVKMKHKQLFSAVFQESLGEDVDLLPDLYEKTLYGQK